jgi:GNAT superfamily N-acetyltransferase
MFILKRTNSGDRDFQDLVKELDVELKVRDGEDHSFFAQFNKIDMIRHALVAYHGNVPVGCGAIKPYDEKTMEVKRMFVPLKHRGQGIASFILQDLEKWAHELGFEKCILETGQKQPEAIRLYQKNNYVVIPNFGQYAGVESSICFEKIFHNVQI